MIKDKRYWQAQLQMKMNEITRETEKLNRERQIMDRERSAKRSFEKKVKEATKELTSKYVQRFSDEMILSARSTVYFSSNNEQRCIRCDLRNTKKPKTCSRSPS